MTSTGSRKFLAFTYRSNLARCQGTPCSWIPAPLGYAALCAGQGVHCTRGRAPAELVGGHESSHIDAAGDRFPGAEKQLLFLRRFILLKDLAKP